MAGKRDYEKLPIKVFGRHLIKSGDLDPVYITLQSLDWKEAQRARWLIAYWCFYHCGLASYASQFSGDKFWQILAEAAHNEQPAPTGGRWPRGHERRHSRGEQGRRMIKNLALSYGGVDHSPLEMINWIKDAAPDFKEVSRRVQVHPYFGPWIGFKVADMVDALYTPVDFTEAGVFMFKDPVKAAMMLWRQQQGFDEHVKPKDQGRAIHDVVSWLMGEFSDLQCPHAERGILLQEVETVLCCWKSHMNGHYGPYNDINEIRAGLPGWGTAAEEFLNAMPLGGEKWLTT